MAKDVRMVEVSEYGISIVHPAPFREGVFMRFFSPLFGEHPDGIIGRCNYCEKTEADHGGVGGAAGGAAGASHHATYHCNFILFGAHDELLRRIRSWIREDYVHKKEGSG
jgi:hypothetical protein